MNTADDSNAYDPWQEIEALRKVITIREKRIAELEAAHKKLAGDIYHECDRCDRLVQIDDRKEVLSDDGIGELVCSQCLRIAELEAEVQRLPGLMKGANNEAR